MVEDKTMIINLYETNTLDNVKGTSVYNATIEDINNSFSFVITDTYVIYQHFNNKIKDLETKMEKLYKEHPQLRTENEQFKKSKKNSTHIILSLSIISFVFFIAIITLILK